MPAKQIPAQDERKTASQAILGLTAGILECVRPSMQLKNGRVLDSQGSRQGSHRRQHQQVPGTGPANLSNLQPPRAQAQWLWLCSWLPPPSAGQSPRAGGQTAAPRHLPAAGLLEGTAPLLCRASLSPPLSGAQAPGSSFRSSRIPVYLGLEGKSKVVKL